MQPRTLTDLIYLFVDLFMAVVPVIASLALLYFFWGIAELILNAGDPKKLGQARQKMVWGVIVLFVIFTLGGLVMIVQNTFFP